MAPKLCIRAAVVAALLATGTAIATPLALAPGGSGTVPVYNGRPAGTTTLLAAECGYFSGAGCTTSVSSLMATGTGLLLSEGGFIEVAGMTGLNPYGSSDVTFAFLFAIPSPSRAWPRARSSASRPPTVTWCIQMRPRAL